MIDFHELVKLLRGTIRCGWCLLPVDTVRDRPKITQDGETVYFCNEDHKERYVKGAE